MTTIVLITVQTASSALAQTAPGSPDHPWHGPMEREIEANANGVRESRFSIDQAKTYSLAEQIDLAEAHNPETRVAWERARAQAAALGVARSELYPTLAAAALSHTYRSEDLVGTRFFRQTIQDFQVALDLNYTVFDFARDPAESLPRGRRSWRLTSLLMTHIVMSSTELNRPTTSF
jgi:outer membrane protein